MPEGKYVTLIDRLRPQGAIPGDIVHLDGRVLGRHDGVTRYTVGQRRGLNIAVGEPLFVVRLDADRREVIVGPREALLTRSRDVWNTERGHPAYARILEEMAPDEARILLLLLRGGPQPAVDVRTGGPIGMVSSRLVAPGLNMIGPRAGIGFVRSS